MIDIIKNVNIKNKNYRLDSIIKSFLKSADGMNVKDYKSFSHVTNGNEDIVTKLCIEAKKVYYDRFSEVIGVSFCLNNMVPYYVSYHCLADSDGSLIVPYGACFMRVMMVPDTNQECVIPDVDLSDIDNFIRRLKSLIIDNFAGCVGNVVSSNIDNSIIVDNMKIHISHNDIVNAMADVNNRYGNSYSTVYDVYNSISKRIIEKRNRHTDLNWFVYKTYIIHRLLKEYCNE